MLDPPRGLLERHQVVVDKDRRFQRRARLLQAIWREEKDLPIGERKPRNNLGSRLPAAFGEKTGKNMMTDAARLAARRELDAAHPPRGSHRRASGQNIQKDRLWANLLSSQPLAFNLFANFENNLGAASRVLRRLWPTRIGTITKMLFEHSPGRLSSTFTSDKTAFDIYFEQTTPSGGRGFVGIEVKYAENMNDAPAEHRTRYDEVTEAMACFRREKLGELRRRPIEQIWRDHMLMGSMLLDARSHWDDALYLFLYPKDNDQCADAVEQYVSCLSDRCGFEAVTMEAIVDAIEHEANGRWIHDIRDRYLGWHKIDRLIEGSNLRGSAGSRR